MFCIKVFSLQFTAWSCTSYSRCDRNHQGLLVNKVFVVKFSAKNELFKFSVKNRPGALCHAIPRDPWFPMVRYNPHSRFKGSVVTVVCLFCWNGSKCASRVCTTTFGNGRFYKKHQLLWVSINNDYYVYNGIGVPSNIPGIINNRDVHDVWRGNWDKNVTESSFMPLDH